MSALVTIIADTHQRPKRHAHRGLRDDGVPMLHVVPIRARLRQLLVVLRPGIVDTSKTKAQIRAKGTTERASLLI